MAKQLRSLADLVRPQSVQDKFFAITTTKPIGEPNAFVIGVAKTLIQVAQYHTGATSKEVGELKRLAGNLPAVPFDLTAKNKTLLRQLESDRLRAKLYFLPEQLMGEVAKDLERGRVRFVEAQVAIAIDILLALPLRPQNLSSLSWRQHFSEPNGPRGQLLLHIAARDTKTKRQDIVSEVPDEVARRLRWYRRHILAAPWRRREWPPLRHGERHPQGPSNAHSADHRRHHAAYRHSHDAASVPAFRCDLLSRGASGGFRDGARRSWVTPGARPHASMRAHRAGEPAGHTTNTCSSSAKRSSCCAQEESDEE